MTYHELIEFVQRVGFISIARGVSILNLTARYEDDLDLAVESVRRNAPELFHKHRRGVK